MTENNEPVPDAAPLPAVPDGGAVVPAQPEVVEVAAVLSPPPVSPRVELRTSSAVVALLSEALSSDDKVDRLVRLLREGVGLIWSTVALVCAAAGVLALVLPGLHQLAAAGFGGAGVALVARVRKEWQTRRARRERAGQQPRDPPRRRGPSRLRRQRRS